MNKKLINPIMVVCYPKIFYGLALMKINLVSRLLER